jgi:hypothetical protein
MADPKRKHDRRVLADAERPDAVRSALRHERAVARSAQADAERWRARAVLAEARALRVEVAFERGLDPNAARWLRGSTREELEADAAELRRVIERDQGHPLALRPDAPRAIPCP